MLHQILALLTTISAEASTQAPNLHLSWSAPGSCPSVEQVRAQIHALLTKGAADALTRPVYVIATVKQASERQWVLEIEWHGQDLDSAKTVESDSCVDLARAAALTTALIVDPNANAPVASSGPETASGSATEVVVPEVTQAPSSPRRIRSSVSATPPPHAEHARSTVSHLELSLAAESHSGVLPEPSIGVTPGAMVRRGAWAALVEIGMQLPQSWNKDGYGGTLWLGEVLLAPCYGIETGRLRVAPCLGATWLSYWARTNPASDAPQRTDWTNGVRSGPGIDVRYRLSSAAVVFGSVWVLGSVKWPEFRLHPSTEVFAPDGPSFRVSIGAAYEVL